MIPFKIWLSQIPKESEKTYVVVLESGTGGNPVRARFEVSITPRQRSGSTKELQHHNEVEKLEGLAKQEVLHFCRMMASEDCGPDPSDHKSLRPKNGLDNGVHFHQNGAPMPLRLPAKTDPPTAANVQLLQTGLTSVIAGHPGSIQPWTSYEEMDAYLGPWGKNGYLIAYGKYYCKAFNDNDNLQNNPQTSEWVRRTTIALQEPLRDLVVDRFRSKTLATLKENELRQFAFSVHPKAYTQGGLALVAMTAPEMLPIIASIPSAQFNPASPNFSSSVTQVFATMGMVLPQTAGMGLAALAGPAHTGLFARAAQMDMAQLQREQNTGRWLTDTLRVVGSGEMDSIPLLNRLTDRLNNTQFGDRSLATLARQVVQTADGRKHSIARYYRDQIAQNPSLKPNIDQLV